MKEAIIGLIGVFIGGAIGVVGQFMSYNFENKKWKKEKNVEQLRIQKENLEKKYEKYILKLHEGVEKNSYDTEMISDIMYTFPENVYESFKKLNKEMLEEKKDQRKIKFSVFNVIGEMKKSLKEIDSKIKEEISK